MITNGAYFEKNPAKILGEIYDTTDRFGKALKAVKGNMQNVAKGIDVAEVRRFDQFVAGQKIEAKEQNNKVREALQKTKAEEGEKSRKNHPCREGLQCLSDSIKSNNSGISKEAMKVWVTYQVNRGLFDKDTILKNDWKEYYVEKADFLKSQLGNHVAFDGNEYIPNVLFYAGNIYQKLLALKAQKEAIIKATDNTIFEAQFQKLDATKPTPLQITDGEEHKLTLSPFDKIFRDFRVSALADSTGYEEPKDLIEIFSWEYLNTLSTDDFIFKRQKTSSYDIRNHWLERNRFSRGTPESEKAARKRAAQTIGTLLFDRFLFESLTREDRLRLAYLWNSRHNNYVEPDWNQIPVAFEISQFFKGGKLEIRPAQREGVAFLNTNGTGIIAYDVGVGKTMTAILYIADMMAKGLCKRPLIVVPNPTYEKWIGEVNGVFAKKDIRDPKGKLIHKKGDLIAEGILPQYPINDYYNLGSGYLSKALDEKEGTLQVEAHSITVISYEGLMKIGFRESSEGKLVNSIKAILSQGETGREAAIVEEKIASMVDKSLEKSEVNIEDMGIDAIIVDEAHNFKNLFTQVRGEAVVGTYGDVERQTNHYELQGKSPSARAIKLFMLNRYIQLHHNRRNTIGLTATPFTNSPLEIYSIQALFDYDGLKEHGIENIVDYFNTFIDESYEAVWTSRGQFEQRAVVRGFNNLPTMQAIIFKYILYKTGEEANIQRPTKVVLPLKNDETGLVLPIEYQANTEIPATEEQKSWFKDIANFARQKQSEISLYYPSDYRGNVPGRDLIAINAAQLATYSPYLLPWRQIDESSITPEEFMASSPKMKFVADCIKSVKQYHESRDEEVSGQVIYTNRGTKFFPHIREFLIENIGYQSNEVGIIIGGTSAKKKEQIKKDFLDGKVKVIIGSSTIREGIDLQKRSSVLYNCYLDWNPTDIKQLEGRIWRFGNIFSHVRIVVPMIENSFDIFLNQKLGEKTSRVNNIWSRSGRSTVLKLEDLNPDELKKGLITDPEELVKMEVEEQVQDLAIQRDLYRGYTRQLGEAATEKTEVDRLWNKLQLVAERAKEGYMYPAAIAKEVVNKIIKMEITSEPKSVYKIVKAYADTRDWSEKYDLKRSIDEHIKKLKKLRRTERDILAKNDLTIQNDFQKLILDFETKIATIETDIQHIKSESNKQQLLEAFIEEREKKNQESQSIPIRVKEFERLNFLLECKDANFDGIPDEGNICDIYGINRGDGKQIIKAEKPKMEKHYSMSKELKAFLPAHQKSVIRDWPEVTKLQVLLPLEKQIAAIPKRQKATDFNELIVYAHFFYGSSDWFITEWDQDQLLFGYTILNGDVQMSELGSLSLHEITRNGKVELDFYWTPKSLSEVLYKTDSDYFPKPKTTNPEKPVTPKEQKPLTDKDQKLKVAKAKAAAQKQRIRILAPENNS
jgi:helicase-like protein/SNF2 domain-containing protein